MKKKNLVILTNGKNVIKRILRSLFRDMHGICILQKR
jgi:RNase P protein component